MAIDLEHPWNIVFLAGFLVYTSIRHVYAGRLKAETSVMRRVDALEKGLLTFVVLGTLVAPPVYLFTPLLRFADYRLPGFVPWIGVPLMPVALWLFRRSHSDLGRQWSISLEVRPDHKLITGGVYRTMRHPMYLAIWLWGVVQAAMLANWIAGFGTLLTFAPLYFLRAPREEAMMCEVFGDAYREYMGRTRRIIPF